MMKSLNQHLMPPSNAPEALDLEIPVVDENMQSAAKEAAQILQEMLGTRRSVKSLERSLLDDVTIGEIDTPAEMLG